MKAAHRILFVALLVGLVSALGGCALLDALVGKDNTQERVTRAQADLKRAEAEWEKARALGEAEKTKAQAALAQAQATLVKAQADAASQAAADAERAANGATLRAILPSILLVLVIMGAAACMFGLSYASAHAARGNRLPMLYTPPGPVAPPPDWHIVDRDGQTWQWTGDRYVPLAGPSTDLAVIDAQAPVPARRDNVTAERYRMD